MHTASSILAVMGAISLGAMSPGPSFVMIAKTAVSSSRSNALAAAIGMGFGALLFAIAAIIGLKALFLAIPTLYISIKILGGLYLAYIGIRIWRGAEHPLSLNQSQGYIAQRHIFQSFILGLTTQLSNPKTAIIYTSVFAALMPENVPLIISALLILSVFVIEAGWYTIVATVLSSSKPRATYLKFKSSIDRAAGGVMIFLGLKLAATSSH